MVVGTFNGLRSGRPLCVWALGSHIDNGLFERLGDARDAADRLDCHVGVLLVGERNGDPHRLIHHGADAVCVVEDHHAALGLRCRVAVAVELVETQRPRLIFVSGDCHGREWAAMLAARCGCRLISPALLVSIGDCVEVTRLDATGTRARRVECPSDQTAILTLVDGVGEARPADTTRRGQVIRLVIEAVDEPVQQQRVIPADPATVDIRHANRLVSGGRGLGGKEGFALLRRFADRLGAGVAASRMAVDLGWIERDRQVGQTGKTVTPDLYIACGISGASHHLEGMSAAEHIVAINTDPRAPIFKVAKLGLVGDLRDVLTETEKLLDR